MYFKYNFFKNKSFIILLYNYIQNVIKLLKKYIIFKRKFQQILIEV